ncbi:MAG: 4-hydroxy-2-oxovalerate aldolase [Candidatus Riflebacteria bacterium]|nr:4-hydroxy-2-oxovalerate aldolase [Candidatus Riflebacteria bacterium]
MNPTTKPILICDVTLRDGSHAVAHQLTAAQMEVYARAAEKAGIGILEIGHGNGLGASSLQVGLAATDDRTLLRAVRPCLSRTRLGVFVIPGFATINHDLKPAIQDGADVVKVASHCTEADTTQRLIGFARESGKETFGVLMMSHMAPKETLLEESRKMQSYGAEGVILMDSAGAYLPEDVAEKVRFLVEHLSIPVGFHSHNNLGMAVANALEAARHGATILDGTARGFGAGAGNAPIEVMVGVLQKAGFATGVDLYGILDAVAVAEREVITTVPSIRGISLVSGLAGVFSGFAKHVERVAKEYAVDPRDVFFELGRRRAVAGQEDLIIDVAIELADKGGKNRGHP